MSSFFKPLLFPIVTAAFTAAGWSQQPASLDMQRVTTIYIERNLDLEIAKYRLERSKADQIAAPLRPNPSLAITTENIRLSGPTSIDRLYEIGASYSETIELGGKRALREQAADATVSAAEAQFSDTMRRGVADVKRLYLEAVLARYNLAVAAENRETFEQLVQFNLARFREGTIPEGDLIKVRLERFKFDSAVKQSELGLRQSTIHLLEKLGETDFSNHEIAGELDLPLLRPELESLRQIAVRQRSDVLAAERELASAGVQLALEEAKSRPDLTTHVGYKRLASDHTLMFGVSVPLKIRDRNQASIARAESDKKIAEARMKIARNRALAEVTAAYEAFQTASDEVQTFRDEMLNQADESRSIALAAYQEGASSLLSVLEAQRTRSEVREQYFRRLFDYQISLVELELAVGKEIQP